MRRSRTIVVTSINHPNRALRELANGAEKNGDRFIIIGDSKSPDTFVLNHARFYSLQEQTELRFEFARRCPAKHYARKNIGYLLAAKEGADVILETDDDNRPIEGFFDLRQRFSSGPMVTQAGWFNAYSAFTHEMIWPRGLPLSEIHASAPPTVGAVVENVDCPIQQGLADGDPDVDAIYRLTYPLPLSFEPDRTVLLGGGVWCPFNSQNTTWWREAFPLLYLPFYCSFRMTDIWRSFVAQRIAWENDWRLLFHSSTVFQERNEHDLMRDFEEELPGYKNNERIRKTLEDLPLHGGVNRIPDNLISCYQALIKLRLIGQEECELVRAWLSDLAAM